MTSDYTVGESFGSSKHREAKVGPESTLPVGAVLGDAFVVADVVGTGSTSVVYLARDKALDRDVAIKLCAPRANADHTDRLLRQANATAALNHPHVVGVHYVGEFGTQVFVVMEYMGGGTLAQWLDAGPHAADAIVEKFVDAARGLAAAHDVGLVHHRFSPASVFIGRDGRAKVGGFGIESDQEEAATLDQFALCVALFEALSGVHPFEGATSEAIAAAIAAGRRRRGATMSGPAAVRRAVERGLSVRPEDRHVSMPSLIDALTPSRRKLPYLAAGGVLAAGLVAILAPSTSSNTCTGFRVTPPAWSDAQSLALRDAITGARLMHGPGLALRVESSVVASLEQWRDAQEQVCRIGERGDGSVAVRQACLHDVAIQLQSTLALLVDAEVGTLARALELIHRVPAASDCVGLELPTKHDFTGPVTPQARAAVARAEVAFRAGAFDEAATYATAAIDGGAQERTRARALLMRARVTDERREYDAFHEQAEQVLSVAIEIGADDIAGDVASILAHVHGSRENDLPTALRWAERAKAWYANTGETSAAMISLAVHTGLAYSRAGKAEEAVEQLNHALAIVRGRKRSEPATEAQVLLNYGVALNGAGRPEDAEAAVRQGLRVAARELGVDHPIRMSGLTTLISIFHNTGRSSEAVPWAMEVLERRVRQMGPNNPRVAAAHNNLALVLMEAGQPRAALVHGRQALEIFDKRGNTEQLREFLSNLASMEVNAGELETALEHARRSLLLAENVENLVVRIGALNQVADILLRRGDAQAALTYARRSSSLSDEHYPPAHPDLGTVRVLLGIVAQDLGQPAQALAMFGEARAIFAATDAGAEHSDGPYADAGYARALVDLGRPKEAIPLLVKQLEVLVEGHELVVLNNVALARARAQTGDETAARAALQSVAAVPGEYDAFVALYPELRRLSLSRDQ